MPNVVREGDINILGGVAQGGASTVFAEGMPIMTPNQLVTPHGCCGAPGCGQHCDAKTQGGSSTVFAEGKPVINTSDIDSCGDSRTIGATTIFVGK